VNSDFLLASGSQDHDIRIWNCKRSVHQNVFHLLGFCVLRLVLGSSWVNQKGDVYLDKQRAERKRIQCDVPIIKTRQDKIRQDKTRQDKTRQDKIR
jgi:hypothetical protein